MPIVKLPGGQLRDEIRMPLYDSLDQVAAESPIATRVFFQDVQGKPRSMTNLRQNGLLETAVSYRIQGFAIDVDNVYANLRQGLQLIMEQSSLRLHVGEKDYWEGQMRFAAGRVKTVAAVGNTAPAAPVAIDTVSLVNQHFGDEAIQGVMFPGDHFVDVNPLQAFYLEWVCGAGGAPYAMTPAEAALGTPAAGQRLRWVASLKGLMRRPVQ